MRMEYTDHVTGIDQSQSRIAKWRHELPTDPGTELNERARVWNGFASARKQEICVRASEKGFFGGGFLKN